MNVSGKLLAGLVAAAYSAGPAVLVCGASSKHIDSRREKLKSLDACCACCKNLSLSPDCKDTRAHDGSPHLQLCRQAAPEHSCAEAPCISQVGSCVAWASPVSSVRKPLSMQPSATKRDDLAGSGEEALAEVFERAGGACQCRQSMARRTR